jgi:hypothetical protein
MKKFLILGFTALCLVTSSFAASNEKVSSQAVTQFESKFSGATAISWTVTDNFEKASFILANEKMDAYYDANGALIGTSKVLAFDKLPKSARTQLTTEYTFPDYQLTDCIEFTDADNNKNYFVSFENENENVILSVSASGLVSPY